MARSGDRDMRGQALPAAAANGLIDRRALLGRGMVIAGAMGAGIGPSPAAAGAEPLTDDPWSLEFGDPMPPYQVPSKFEAKVVRTLSNPNHQPRNSHARTPHHLLEGTITPNGLHFAVSPRRRPDIDPDKHRLVIHGLVKQPLVFTLDALSRYPMVSRMSLRRMRRQQRADVFAKEPIQANVQALHGLVSCAEWTGVRLSHAARRGRRRSEREMGDRRRRGLAAMSRSVPLAKAMDDAMIALYQNGERLMPVNGYPMRLLLPGYEGNMNVKWLRRIKLVEQPVMATTRRGTIRRSCRTAKPSSSTSRRR